jgi:hypothetical protein
MSKLADGEEAAIRCDTLPHYYMKKMKEANQTPLEIPLEEMLDFALNIEEAAVNPGTDAEVNSNYSNFKKT